MRKWLIPVGVKSKIEMMKASPSETFFTLGFKANLKVISSYAGPKSTLSKHNNHRRNIFFSLVSRETPSSLMGRGEPMLFRINSSIIPSSAANIIYQVYFNETLRNLNVLLRNGFVIGSNNYPKRYCYT